MMQASSILTPITVNAWLWIKYGCVHYQRRVPTMASLDSSYCPSNVIPKPSGKEELVPKSSLTIKGESNLHVV